MVESPWYYKVDSLLFDLLIIANSVKRGVCFFRLDVVLRTG